MSKYSGVKILDEDKSNFFKNFSGKHIYDVDGYYITIGQLGFFLNRRNGEKLFKDGHPAFIEYYNKCLVYNYISDLKKEDFCTSSLCQKVVGIESRIAVKKGKNMFHSGFEIRIGRVASGRQ